MKNLIIIILAFLSLSFVSENGCNDQMISKSKLMSEQGIHAYLHDFPYDAKFEVVSYEWTVVFKEGDMHSGISKSKYFTKSLKEFFPILKKNDHIFLEKIQVKGPDDLIRKINGISLRII